MIQSIEEIDKGLAGKKNELEALFSIQVKKILVNIMSKDEFKKLGLKEWIIAFADPRRNLITIIKQEESGRNLTEWRKVIIHEMVHVFYDHKVGDRKPFWLSEGIACFIAGQKKKSKKVTMKDLINHFSEINEETYTIGYNAVKNCLGEK